MLKYTYIFNKILMNLKICLQKKDGEIYFFAGEYLTFVDIFDVMYPIVHFYFCFKPTPVF